MSRSKLTQSVAALKAFALAGDATFTLHNTVKNTHVTLWFRRAKKRGDAPGPIFVKALTGDRTDDGWRSTSYRYLGCIWDYNRREQKAETPHFSYGCSKAKLPRDDARTKAAAWVLDVINGKSPLPDYIEIFHEGRCCFCHKELTQPESVRRGYGPECAAVRALPYGKTSIPEKGPDGSLPQPIDALDVPCPRANCAAASKHRCRTRQGGIQSRPHRVRVEAARQHRDNPQPKPKPAPRVAHAVTTDTEGRSYEAAPLVLVMVPPGDEECMCGSLVTLGVRQCPTCGTQWAH